MDYIYACRIGDNEELRYSIRSVMKNCATVDNIWVIGYKPDWYAGNFISVPNRSTKYENIKNCLRAAIDNPNISEDFVYMNDDFFVTRPMAEIPTMHGGLLQDKINKYLKVDSGSGYVSSLQQTAVNLRRRAIRAPLDYDLHTPIVFNKTLLRSVIDEVGQVRTNYGNIHDIEAIESTDVKTYSAEKYQYRSYDYLNNDLPYISTEDVSFVNVYNDILKDMFPDPSIYEYPRQDSNLQPNG